MTAGGFVNEQLLEARRRTVLRARVKGAPLVNRDLVAEQEDRSGVLVAFLLIGISGAIVGFLLGKFGPQVWTVLR